MITDTCGGEEIASAPGPIEARRHLVGEPDRVQEERTGRIELVAAVAVSAGVGTEQAAVELHGAELLVGAEVAAGPGDAVRGWELEGGEVAGAGDFVAFVFADVVAVWVLDGFWVPNFLEPREAEDVDFLLAKRAFVVGERRREVVLHVEPDLVGHEGFALPLLQLQRCLMLAGFRLHGSLVDGDVVVAKTTVSTTQKDSGVHQLSVDLCLWTIVEHDFIVITPAAYVLSWQTAVVLGFCTELLHGLVVRIPAVLKW